MKSKDKKNAQEQMVVSDCCEHWIGIELEGFIGILYYAAAHGPKKRRRILFLYINAATPGRSKEKSAWRKMYSFYNVLFCCCCYPYLSQCLLAYVLLYPINYYSEWIRQSLLLTGRRNSSRTAVVDSKSPSYLLSLPLGERVETRLLAKHKVN